MAAATASTSHQSLNPTVEDYDSDVDSVKVSNFNRPPSASQANVTAKRSHPSDLGSDKSPPTEKVGFSDRQSDSGYSSHTAATVSSADSAISAKSQSPPVAAVNHLEDPEPLLPTPPSPAQRRPTLVDERRRSNQTSPVKPLQRAPSVSSRNRPARERRPTESRSVDCTDPTCKKCVSTTAPTTSTSTTRGRRPVPPHLDSAVDVSYPPSTRSDPVAPSYTSPNSPTYTRQASYMHGSTVVQPATTRRRSSSNARARPQSYHGDPRQPGYSYNMNNVPAPYPSPPQEQSQPHGPPPAMSAHFAMQHPGQQHPAMQQYGGQVHPMYQAPMPGMPHGYYPPPQMQQTSPPYEPQRPHMPTRNSSSSFNARGSMYGQPRVTQEQKALPSARYAPQPQVQQALVRQEALPQKQLKYAEESESEYTSSEEGQEEEEEEIDDRRRKRNSRALMPPPQLVPAPVQQNRPSPQRRPSLHRRPNTTPQVYPSERRASVSQPHILAERPREQRDTRPSRANSSAQARSQSKARPSMPLKAQSAYDTRDARVIVENGTGKPRRRKPQVYDVDYNVEDKRRSRVYDFEDKPRPKVIEVEDRRRPRNYEAIERRRSHVAPVESKRQSKIYVESLSDDSESDDYDVPPQRRRVQEVYQEERPQRRRKEDMYADEVAPQRRRKDDFYEEDEVMPLQRRRKEEIYDEDAIVPAPRRRKDFYEDDIVPQPPQQPLRRRKTVTEHDNRPSRQAKMQDAVNDIEAYQRQTRGNDVPLNDLAHRAAKRTSRVVRPGDDDDEDGSSHSGGKTRISQSNRTTVTNGNNGDIRLRIDASNPISLHLPGDMEGRTLQINPAEDGMADIVIANQRDTESTYRSERGSMYGAPRRAITSSDQARREAEVQSMKSVRTSNSRREERKPLRRSRRDIEVDDR